MKSKRRNPVLLTVPAKTPIAKVRKLIQNPVKLTEDKADYQLAMASVRSPGKDIPLSAVIREYGWQKR